MSLACLVCLTPDTIPFSKCPHMPSVWLSYLLTSSSVSHQPLKDIPQVALRCGISASSNRAIVSCFTGDVTRALLLQHSRFYSCFIFFHSAITPTSLPPHSDATPVPLSNIRLAGFPSHSSFSPFTPASLHPASHRIPGITPV